MKKSKRLKRKHIDAQMLEFIGQQYMDKPRMQLFIYNNQGFSEKKDIQYSDLPAFSDTESVYWLNLHGIHDVELIQKICSKYSIHRLVVQDILDTDRRPKLQDFGDYLFFEIKSALPTENNELKIEQISFILGKNFVISFQEKPGDYFEHIRQSIREKKGLIRERSADYLLFILLESILDNYFTTLEEFEPKVYEIITIKDPDPEPSIMQQIEDYKKQILDLKRSIMPLYDAIGSIEKGISEQILPEHLKYFFNLRDQCSQLLENIEALVQRLDSGINLFFSIQGHRMNDVMKTLTIITAIFIPLSFIAGVYGMNFEVMPELSWKYGYFIILGIMVITVAAMFYYFKKKKWF